MTNRREKILFGFIVFLLALYLLRFVGNRYVLEPMRLQRLQAMQVQREIRLKTRRLETLRHAEERLHRWRERSLPPNVAKAQTMYQDYLFELVQEHQVENWIVESGTVFTDEHLTQIPFRVTGRVTLASLSEMLYQIYQNQLLHRIRRLDLERVNESDQDLRMVLQLDAISIAGAFHREELLPEELAGGGPLSGVARESFAVITERDILTPLRETPPFSPVMGSPRVADNRARDIHLTGTPFWGDSRQAWLHDRKTNATWFLRDGQEFEIAGVSGKLSNVAETHVELVIDGRRRTLSLNGSLGELAEID